MIESLEVNLTYLISVLSIVPREICKREHLIIRKFDCIGRASNGSAFLSHI